MGPVLLDEAFITGKARADVTVAGVLLASTTGWWTGSLISLCTLPLREL